MTAQCNVRAFTVEHAKGVQFPSNVSCSLCGNESARTQARLGERRAPVNKKKKMSRWHPSLVLI